MTDRPSPGTTTDAVPAPGYYPDPSIPGFVRYWDGSAWAPGTSRPAPEPGEVLAPPRLVARRSTPSMRYVPPPVAAAHAPASAPEEALEEALEEASEAGAPVRRGWAGPAALDESGPVYFDETTGGTSFTTEPRPQAAESVPGRPHTSGPQGPPSRAAGALPALPPSPSGPAAGGALRPEPQSPSGGPLSPVAPPWTAAVPVDPGPWGSPTPSAGEPAPVRASRPAPAPGAPQPSGLPSDLPSGDAGRIPAEPSGAHPVPGAFAAPPAGRTPTQPDRRRPGTGEEQGAGEEQGGGSGWQADAGNQRGLMDSQASPRWVSWGVTEPAAPELPDGARPDCSTETRLSPPSPPPAPRRPSPGTAHRAPDPGAPAPAPRSSSAPGAVRAPEERPTPREAAAPGAGGATERRGPRPAGFGRRLAARLIDTLVVWTVAAAAGIPLAVSVVDHLRAKVDAARQSGRAVRVWLVDPTVLGRAALFLLVLLLVGVVCEALPTARWGRTVGKRIARVRVLATGSRRPPGLGGSLRRWLAMQLLAATVVGGVLDALWCLFDRPLRQCWHDKAGGTFLAVEGAVPATGDDPNGRQRA